ncbi:MAG: LPS export ABC transporter periplasmic protein LptC [Spirochaetaceae bacterium]|nr:LPS export ABC transporter periplasmic protein LptC [Spirochaetaceae bacterium]
MARSRAPGGPTRRSAPARVPAAAAVVAALFLGACSFDYGTESGAEVSAPPNATFRDFRHSVVIDGARVFELRAERAETYDAARKTLLFGVSFVEYDRRDGAVATEGGSDAAILYTDTEDAEFSGNIRIDSRREDAVVAAEYLAWNAAEKKLASRLDRAVEIRRGDGSWVRGAGFSADARRRSFAFREAAAGSFAAPGAASDAGPEAEPAAAPAPETVPTPAPAAEAEGGAP